MKSVLIILTQANLNSLQIHESLSATMVLATFGAEVKVLLRDSALSLLNDKIAFEPLQHAFKLGSNMVNSFEFYDLTPILVDSTQRENIFVQHTSHDLEFIEFNKSFIQSFDHVLYW